MCENYFQPKRFYHLILRDVYSCRDSIITFAGSIILILLLFNLIHFLSDTVFFVQLKIFTAILFIGGFAMASSAFKYIHEKQSAAFYLMIPASKFEKFLSRLLLTSVGYALAVAVFYFLFSFLMYLIGLLFSYHLYVLNLLSWQVWYYIGIYIVLHSVVFLGSIYFPKWAILKTILFFIFILFMLALLGVLLIKIFWPYDFFVVHFFLDQGVYVPRVFSHSAEKIFCLLLAPLCWIIAYFRFCEVEA